MCFPLAFYPRVVGDLTCSTHKFCFAHLHAAHPVKLPGKLPLSLLAECFSIGEQIARSKRSGLQRRFSPMQNLHTGLYSVPEENASLATSLITSQRDAFKWFAGICSAKHLPDLLGALSLCAFHEEVCCSKLQNLEISKSKRLPVISIAF